MSRKQEFLETGAKLAVKVGIVNVTRRAIAEHHKVTDPLVSKYVGGKDEMRKAIKSTMKKLGLKEPAPEVAEAKGKALRARKPARATDLRAKKVVAKKSKVGARSAAASAKATGARGKKVVAKKSAAAGTKRASTTKPVAKSAKHRAAVKSAEKAKKTPHKPSDVARLPTGVDPKKGAPKNKERGKFKTKEAPPLPALPILTPSV